MKWIFLIVGLLIGAAGGFVGNSYWERHRQGLVDNEIVFAEKVLYDSGPNVSYPMIVVSGTLTGPGLRNNTYVVSCEQQVMSCDVAYVEQIGPNQVGRMANPSVFTIKKWGQTEIIADDEAARTISFAKTTITIERKEKTLLWVEEPINQTQPMCKYADTNVRKYTIEDSPGWKKIFGKKD
jgi:hypothetical protein